MRIAVASGKGGTGKTTVATNLAYIASRNGQSVAYLDCDVEEPNGHVFLAPDLAYSEPVHVAEPKVDEAACTNCGRCSEICQFSAILCMIRQVLVFPELCHDCGGCWRVCPEGAITTTPRMVGLLETGWAGEVQFVQGTLAIGEPMSPPVIKAVKAAAPQANLIITDAPPGTSCPVIESVRGSDYVLLVTEPTPFGLHDLKLAVAMTRALGLPFGVVVNRAQPGYRAVQSFCREERIRLLSEIPEDRRIAEVYSRGELICEALPNRADIFADLLLNVTREVAGLARV